MKSSKFFLQKKSYKADNIRMYGEFCNTDINNHFPRSHIFNLTILIKSILIFTLYLMNRFRKLALSYLV